MAPPPALERTSLLGDSDLTGRAFVTEYTSLIDEWIVSLYEAVIDDPSLSLVALGGYGRAELTPSSDLDLALLHRGSIDPATAEQLWYPIWDSGMKLGHSVRTVQESLDLARGDLETATSLCTVRHLAGDAALSEELAADGLATWRKHARTHLAELAGRVERRHRSSPEVVSALEPDLKEGRGGLRDAHALIWASKAGDNVERPAPEHLDLGDTYDTILAVRVELHRVTRRASDVLLLQEQDEIASRLGYADADELMRRVAAAGRRIAWASDEYWYDFANFESRRKLFRSSNRTRRLADGISEQRGRIFASPGRLTGPLAVLEVANVAASSGGRISVSTLADIASIDVPEGRWGDSLRVEFVRLLEHGRAALPVIFALDHCGFWCRLLPEWTPNRNRPQRNAYHRFAVDRHLLETVANAAEIADRVERPDLLVMGALLHDIGKGYPGDHTEVGQDLARDIATRMGYGERDVETLVMLVRHHLLLPDYATRRDLEDPATIVAVTDAVADEERLGLLAALTEADSIATGSAAWGPWKAGLVEQLVSQVSQLLAGDEQLDVTVRAPVTPDPATGVQAPPDMQIEAEGTHLTVRLSDRRMMFSRIAGVLSLNGLDVLSATANTEDGMAIEEFEVHSAHGSDIRWAEVERQLALALKGHLALEARLAERERTYRRPAVAAEHLPLAVKVFNDASVDSTVVEVVGPDRVGLLYRLTRTLSDMDLDIRSARVATMGGDVVDAFYVRDANGEKLIDEYAIGELRRALHHVLETPADPR